MKPIKRVLTFLALGAATLSWSGVQAQTAAPAATDTAAEPRHPPIRNAEARKILMDMANFLSKTQKFSFKVIGGFDVVQKNGQKIEFGEIRTIDVQRPNQLRAEVEQSDGDLASAYFDGKHITAYNETQNLYAQAPVEGSLDATLAYFMKDLKMRMPLAAIVANKSPEALAKRVKSVDYVEDTEMFGTPTAHLAGTHRNRRLRDLDRQGRQARAAPARADLSHAEGAPQYRAQFSEWNLAPKFKADHFTFTVPKDASKIAFLNQVKPAGSAKKSGGAP
jgi:hypothetical protein